MKDQEVKLDAPAQARKVARWWIRGGITASVLVVVLLPTLPREIGWAVLVLTTTLCALQIGIYLGWAKGYEEAGIASTPATQPASPAGSLIGR